MNNPMTSIRESMEVLDKDGHRIGTVEALKMTDEIPGNQIPEEITAEPEPAHEPGVLGLLVDALRTDNVPEELHVKLLREGFIRLDADGLFAADRYIVPEQIDRVSDDKVYLKVSRDELISSR